MICLVFLLPVPPDSPLVEVKEQAVEGGEVELTCSVPRSRPAATLRWYRDRKEIKGVIPNAELSPCGNHLTNKINIFPGKWNPGISSSVGV